MGDTLVPYLMAEENQKRIFSRNGKIADTKHCTQSTNTKTIYEHSQPAKDNKGVIRIFTTRYSRLIGVRLSATRY